MSHIKNIRAHLGGLDALLLLDPISIRYASGFYLTDGAAVIAGDRAYLVTDGRYIEAARNAVADMDILCQSGDRTLYTILKELLADYATVGAEADRMTKADWSEAEKKLSKVLVPDGRILARLRASKDETEIASMVAAQRIAERALEEVLGLIRPGLTEKQVAAELVYRLYKYGGEANSFDPIVVTGAKTSMPHGVPGDNVIAAGDFVTMDFGTMVNGYCSDMTRTVAVGYATDEMRRVYDTVAEAQLAGIAAARPGVPGRDVDLAARSVIEKAGCGMYFSHSFGHSLGLEIHEQPNAARSNDKPLPSGAVISAEPGIYIPGKFGVRIEDVLWLRENSTENITKAPKNLIIL